MRGSPVLPGATVGILGSGQLGRMLALAARRMGYRVHTYSPDTDSPTGQVADREIAAPYEDLDAVAAFAVGVDVVTFEFENVPAATARAVAERVRVRPRPEVLYVTQNRIREKTFLEDRGFPVTPFAAVRTREELTAAAARLGRPGVVKTAGQGYDGKGQVKVDAEGELEGALDAAWAEIGGQEAVYEAFIDLDKEVSVVAARGEDGAFEHFGVLENEHRDHVLDLTLSPGRVSPDVAAEAIEVARGIAEELDVVGVFCVEYFLSRQGRLMVNEIAPRPHNSGHLTIDCCVTDQFEQQLRAACGLPLGTPRPHAPGAMANLLGDLWQGGEPDWATAARRYPQVKLHLYGKADARPGRKMGHLTAAAATVEEAARAVLGAREALDAARG